MRTSGSDELYRLIHSLTTEEKGYFKKFAKRHSAKGNNYLQLFDAINKQKEFEEASLKKKFKDYKVWKSYLFQLILDTMILGHTAVGLRADLMRSVFHIYILQKKGMGDKANQLNRAAINKAHESEIFWLEKELLRILFEQERRSWKINERAKKHKQFFTDLKTVKSKEDECDLYDEFVRELMEINHIKTFKNQLPKNFDRHLPLHLLDARRKFKSIKAKRLQFDASSTYYSLVRNAKEQNKNAYQWYLFEKKLWNQNHPLSSYVNRVMSIRQLIGAYLYSKQADKMFAVVEEMRAVPYTLAIQKEENDICWFTYMQYAYWHSCRHKEGEEFAHSKFPEQVLKQRGEHYRNYILEIYRYRLLFEISNRNYKAVFMTLADFESLGIKQTAQFYYKSCQLSRVLLQLELKEYQLLPVLISNVLKSIKLTPAEAQMLKAIRKMNAVNRNEKIRELLRQLPMGADKIILFNTLGANSWLHAMVTNRSIEDVIRESGEL